MSRNTGLRYAQCIVGGQWIMAGTSLSRGKRAVSILFSEVVRIKQQVVFHIYRRENEGLQNLFVLKHDI